MLKIKECYAGCSCQPSVETSENAFKITLPEDADKGGGAVGIVPMDDSVDFQDTEHFFAEEHIPLGQEQKRTLGLVSEDGVFTNLGL